MSSYRRKLQAALYSEASQSTDEEAYARLGEWAWQNPRVLFRIGRLGIHYTVGVMPNIVTEVMNFPYTRRGIEVVGAGANSTTIYDESRDEVQKIIRASEDVSSHEREQLAGEFTEKILRNTDVHGGVIVPTRVAIEPHPISQNDVIILHQEFLAPDLEAPDNLDEQLRTFGEKSLDELLPEELLPDVVDPANMITIDGEIKLLDTVLLDKESTYPRVFTTAEKILQAMAHSGSRSLVRK